MQEKIQMFQVSQDLIDLHFSTQIRLCQKQPVGEGYLFRCFVHTTLLLECNPSGLMAAALLSEGG